MWFDLMYYDLHSHILPSLDDGPKNRIQAIEMARVAAQDGTEVMVATPHRKDVIENYSVTHVNKLVMDMNRELTTQGINLQFLIGMENHLDLSLSGDLKSGRALSINHSKYVLVELPLFGYPNYVENALLELQTDGVIPVLAHPERIEAIQNDPRRLVAFLKQGMLSQITAGSILGLFGSKVKCFSERLLRNNLVHVVASDTHTPSGPRCPKLTRGFEAATRIVGPERATLMVLNTPRAIVSNDPVDAIPLESDISQREWWI